jgi:hypothetical protein
VADPTPTEAAEADPTPTVAAEAPPPPGEADRDVLSGAAGPGFAAAPPAAAASPAPAAPHDLEVGEVGDVGEPDGGGPEGDERGARTEGAEEDESGQDEADRQRVITISRLDLEKVRTVFVASTQYRDAAERQFRQIASRVFVVVGAEHSGKPTCAIHLAWELLGKPEPAGNPRLYLYRDEQLGIVQLALAGGLEEGSVYIVEDAFAGQVREHDLMPPRLEPLETALDTSRSYLVLTSDSWPGESVLRVQKIEAAASDLDEVFRKHLLFYEGSGGAASLPAAAAKLAREVWLEVEGLQGLKDFLVEPNQIDQFCHRLGLLQRTPDPDREALLALAGQIGAQRREATRPWFNGLDLHEQLFVLFVALLGGLGRRTLFELYAGAVEQLRRDRLPDLPDLGSIGQEELLEQARALDRVPRGVGFCARMYDKEVRHQIGNRHHLLWSLAPYLVDRIERAGDGEVRRGLASALGHLGVDHRRELRGVLERLGDSGERSVATAAGFALCELDRRDSGSWPWIADLLESWASSGNPRLMWAAGAAGWRVYGILGQAAGPAASAADEREGRLLEQRRERLLTILGQLACGASRLGPAAKNQAWLEARKGSRDDREARQRAEARLRAWATGAFRSAVFAVVKIAAVDPARVVSTLGQWLAADRAPGLRRLAQAVSRKLFEAAGGAGSKTLPQRRPELLELVTPLALSARDDAEAVRAMLGALARRLALPDEADGIASSLGRAANRLASPAAAESFRALLVQEWLEGGSPAARRLARALIGRLRALEGIVAERAEDGRALLLVDASAAALADRRGAAATLRLWRALRLWFDTTVGRLGSRTLLAEAGATPDPAALRAGRSRPRLLLPAMEAHGRQPLALVVVLTWGGVADLDDARDQPWARRLVIVSTVAGGAGLSPWAAVALDPGAPEAAVAEVELRIQQLRLQSLAAADARRAPPGLLADAAAKGPLAAKDAKAAKTVGNAGNAEGAGNAENAESAGNAGNAETAERAGNAESAETAESAGNAGTVEKAESAGIAELLGKWIEDLDRSLPSEEDDLAGRILRAARWLMEEDLGLCCRLVCSWLEAKSGGVLAPRMGAAAGLLVARLLALRPLPPPQERAEVLELCRHLAALGGRGVKAALAAARHWLGDPGWAAVLAGDLAGDSGELARWIEVLPAGQEEACSQALAGWSSGDRFAAGTAGKLRRLLALRAAGMAPRGAGGAGDGGRCALVVVDPAYGNPAGAHLLELARRLMGAAGGAVPLVFGRLGHSLPLAAGTGAARLETLRADDRAARPRLLGPLLDAFSPAQVSRVLLLIGAEALDLDDLAASSWAARLAWHGPPGMPAPKGIARFDVPAGADDAEAIRRYLAEEPAG